MHRHPYFPQTTELHKGLADWGNFKALYNPIGNVKDVFQSHNVLDAINRSAGIGHALDKDVGLGYMGATFDPTKEFSYGTYMKNGGNVQKPRTPSATALNPDAGAAYTKQQNQPKSSNQNAALAALNSVSGYRGII